MPTAHGRASLIALGFSEAELGNADAYAVSVHTERLGLAAERAGLDAIDLAVDWLAVRLRYGLAQLPNGQPQPFDRDSRRTLPTRGDLVAVRGLLTQRRWLRSAAMQVRASVLTVDPADPILGALPARLTPADRLALAACRRAASESDALARVQALWEAVEFLVAGVAAPRLFADNDLAAIKDAIPSTVPEPLQSRARDAIGELNQAPLMARLRHLLERDGLPCSEAEIDLLVRLRRTRNDTAHGRQAQPPAPEVLDQAAAIASRLVVSKLWNRGGVRV